MATLEEEIKNALVELKKDNTRKFTQTVELIVNLQKFDVRKESLNIFVSVPHKIKDKKVCAFLTTKNKNIDTITEEEFKRYSDKKELKKLEKRYDFFIAQAILMPKVATTFGRALGPSGKMPSPQLGILPSADDKLIAELKEKINNSIRIRSKEASIKLAVGKQNMNEKDLLENIMTIYNTLLKNFAKGKENIKNIEIKLTMSKPVKISLK